MTFFNLEGERQWKVMHMGALSSVLKFVSTMMIIQVEWDTFSKERRLKNVA